MSGQSLAYAGTYGSARLNGSTPWREHARASVRAFGLSAFVAGGVARLPLAVFAALIFSANLFNTHLLLIVVLAFVAFCLVSSGLYAANDAIDAEADRQHPVKCARPVAAGRISKNRAFGIAAGLVAAGVALAAALGLPFLASVLSYVFLQTLYAAFLKHIAIVDVLVIAAGFVVRAVAGALVISVVVSPWLVLCTGLLALFLAAAKRRHELVLLHGLSSAHRPVLSEYSAELLDSFMVTLSAATITSSRSTPFSRRVRQLTR
jgi:4-hydroxybenzoate polyprenyltransferase